MPRLLPLLMLWLASPAVACECEDREPVEVALAEEDLLVIAEIVPQDPTEETPRGPHRHRFALMIEEVLIDEAGVAGQARWFHEDAATSCAKHVPPGRYLLSPYAVTSRADTLSVSSCSPFVWPLGHPVTEDMLAGVRAWLELGLTCRR